MLDSYYVGTQEDQKFNDEDLSILRHAFDEIWSVLKTPILVRGDIEARCFLEDRFFVRIGGGYGIMDYSTVRDALFRRAYEEADMPIIVEGRPHE